jgi:RNA polymerase sigma factor (TIGR02999 family)
MSHVTELLNAAERGDPQAAGRLLPLVYDELRRLAARQLAHEKPGQTLQATALVHEAYLRLVGAGGDDPRWQGRRHFFAAAAEAMRRILVEAARRKKRLKHGAGLGRVELGEECLAIEPPDEELLALDEALEALEQQDRDAAELVKLRYFAGLSLEQAAETLGVSARTASRDWAYARAWLCRRLGREGPPAD